MKKLRNLLLILLFILGTFFSTKELIPSNTTGGVPIIRAVDGDTVIAKDDAEFRIRLIGIDTPETVHPNGIKEPWGKEASNFTKGQLEGKVVFLEYDEEKEDHYGRHLCYIWTEDPKVSEKPTEDILFNYQLVKEGYARERNYPPNEKYQRLLSQAEKEAIQYNRGIWEIEGDEGPAKGNKKSKLYHMPGDPQYDKLSEKNVVYFQTAKEAELAGFQRAFRR